MVPHYFRDTLRANPYRAAKKRTHPCCSPEQHEPALTNFGCSYFCIRIDKVSAVIFVVMANPRHGVGQSVFVASFRHKIKEVISAYQDVESTRIGRIRVVYLASPHPCRRRSLPAALRWETP